MTAKELETTKPNSQIERRLRSRLKGVLEEVPPLPYREVPPEIRKRMAEVIDAERASW
jgi:hypothetical protein